MGKIKEIVKLKSLSDILKKYKEIIMYLIFGVLTTLVNFIVYMIFAWCFTLNETISNAIAWFISVIFAYITNKIWVFESKSIQIKILIYEILSFFGYRVVSGVLDISMFYFLVQKIKISDIITKIFISIFVIILNYVFSKLIIFKKKKSSKKMIYFSDVIMQNKKVYLEVDNFDNMKKSPVIFFRYMIHMLTFLIAIYIVHLNFSIVSALLALVLIIVVEIILEAIAGAKYSKNKHKYNLIKRIFMFIDKKFHYVILLLAFSIKLFWNIKLNITYIAWIYILNCLCSSIVSLFIYLISKEIFSKRTGQIVAILYSMNIFVSAYCSVPTNQHVFAVLILMATYLLISKRYMAINYIVKHILVALLLACASIFRIEGIIYLIAVIIYLFANSLIKNNGKKEKLISIVLIMLIYVLVNVSVLGVIKITGLSDEYENYLDRQKEIFIGNEKSIEQFELNSKDYWNNINYNFMSDKLNVEKIRQYDSVIFLSCAINSAIIVIYCKIRNIEDERMYLLYLIILINFFVYGLVKENSMYSYVAKIAVYILASGGLAIFKKNAELEAIEKYNVKLLQK